MNAESAKPGPEKPMTTRYILRLHKDEAVAQWQAELLPIDGAAPQRFHNMEALFQYLLRQTESSDHGVSNAHNPV